MEVHPLFVCAYCGQHSDESNLRFSVQQVTRTAHPSSAMFTMRLCSDACAIEYLGRRKTYGHFILTRHKGGPEKTLPPQDGETLANLIRNRQL